MEECVATDGLAFLWFLIPLFIFGIELLVCLAIAAFFVFLGCKLCIKAGYHWGLGFLILVPLVFLCILAFATWPIQKELNELKASDPQ